MLRIGITWAMVGCLLLNTAAKAADWGLFRGPDGTGIAAAGAYPTTWGKDSQVKWQVKLPTPGNGSPIVSNGRVFLASASADGKQRSLLCFDRQDGKPVWTQSVAFAKPDPTHSTNPYAGSTPAADGKHVVVWHASAGLHCYDFSGKALWSRDLGEFKHQWGYGTSPLIYQDRVILHTGPGKRVLVTAIELASGKTLWETDEPQDGNGETRGDGRDLGSWSTPVIASVGGQDQILCALPARLNAYDPASGKIVWFCEGLRGQSASVVNASAIVGEGLCVVMAGFRGPALAVRLTGGQGDVTAKNRVWIEERNSEIISTGVLVAGHVYRANGGPSTIECVEAATGKILWKARAASGNYWGSVISAGENLYVTSCKGNTVVFKPNPKAYEEVAQNDLGESSNSTPAFSDGEIFLRTFDHLYCIGR